VTKTPPSKTINLILFVFFCLVLWVPSSQAQVTVHVNGVVMDLREAVVPDVELVFTGTNIARRVVSNQAGSYDINLPVGVYSVTAREHLFRPFRRAAFRLNESPVTLNIVLEAVASDAPNAPIFYDQVSVPKVSDPALQLLVEFMKRRPSGKNMTTYLNASATFDLLTVQGRSIRLNKLTMELVATGNVVVDDGLRRVHTAAARVNFKDGVPRVVADPPR
jgi:hypothetical protein